MDDSEYKYHLYILPAGTPSVPTLDPPSLLALSYLQLHHTNTFALVPSTSSAVPFLLEAPFLGPPIEGAGNIIKYVAEREGARVDERLSKEDRAEAVAWRALIEEKAGDLLAHSLFSLPPNYPSLTRKLLAAPHYPPTTFLLPSRLRSWAKTRLEPAGLWALGGDAEAREEEEMRRRREGVLGVRREAGIGGEAGRLLGEGKLIDLARSFFDLLLSRLSSSAPYFFGSIPTTLDLLLFAHLHPLLSIPLPNALLPNLLRASYAPLVAHHARLSALLFSQALPPSLPPPLENLLTLPLRLLSSSSPPKKEEVKEKEKKKEQQSFERYRWLWIAGALVSAVVYVFASGLVRIEVDDDEEEREWEEVDGEEEEVHVDEDDEEEEDEE